MGLIKRFLCWINGHYMPGYPIINKDGSFEIICVKCGKKDFHLINIDKDINHARNTSQSSI